MVKYIKIILSVGCYLILLSNSIIAKEKSKYNLILYPLNGIGIEMENDKFTFGVGILKPSDILYKNDPYKDQYKGKSLYQELEIISPYITIKEDNLKFLQPDFLFYFEYYFFKSLYINIMINRFSSSIRSIKEYPFRNENYFQNFYMNFQELDLLYLESSYKLFYSPAYFFSTGIGYKYRFYNKYFIKISYGLIFEKLNKNPDFIYFSDLFDYYYFRDFYTYNLSELYINKIIRERDYKRFDLPYQIQIAMGVFLF
ncbi:MAG: hypothetical protein KatS3mg129_2481 [Leptospiraceae bacterium]|nr:MAG: hypothetical protein KatS3mg129_2481 [Leptospiraceae bacterium]